MTLLPKIITPVHLLTIVLTCIWLKRFCSQRHRHFLGDFYFPIGIEFLSTLGLFSDTPALPAMSSWQASRPFRRPPARRGKRRQENPQWPRLVRVLGSEWVFEAFFSHTRQKHSSGLCLKFYFLRQARASSSEPSPQTSPAKSDALRWEGFGLGLNKKQRQRSGWLSKGVDLGCQDNSRVFAVVPQTGMVKRNSANVTNAWIRKTECFYSGAGGESSPPKVLICQKPGQNPWSFGKKTLKICAKFLKFRAKSLMI